MEQQRNCTTRENIRKLDRIAIEEYQIPGIILMENAGAGATFHILQRVHQGPVAIFCGRGNNGGDGFVIARHLHNHRVPVQVFFVGDMQQVKPDSDAGINLTILKKMQLTPVEIKNERQFSNLIPRLSQTEIIVDALLGTGLSGNIRPPLFSIMQEIAALNKPVIAIDIPSGLDANTGDILGTVLKANMTITFALAKKGFFCGKGPEVTGDIKIVEISIPRELLEKKCIE